MRDRPVVPDEAIDRVVGAWLTPPDDPLFVQRVVQRLPPRARLLGVGAWGWPGAAAVTALVLAVAANLTSPPGEGARLTASALTAVSPFAAPARPRPAVVGLARAGDSSGSRGRAIDRPEADTWSDTEWGIAPMPRPEPLVIDRVAVAALDIEQMEVPALAIADVDRLALTVTEPED